jgi:hypothetical protein
VNEHQQSLYERIQAFAIGDPAAALPFAARLARDNGWTVMFAERVVREYRRFVFLAMEAGHPVTPSDEVDQAWHLHLVYTESYWDDFCGGILGRRLHHGPTRGGKREGDKFNDWYARTLESYRAYFGEPPADIWPASAIRFGSAPFFRRVNGRANWIISKRRVNRLAAGGATLAGCAILVGCGVLVAQASAGKQQVSSVVIVIALGVVALIAVLIFGGKIGASRSGRGGQSGSGCGAGGCGGVGGSGCGSDGGGSGCGGGGCGGGCGGS